MKTTENNKLIAEFMGMQNTPIGWYDNEGNLKLSYTKDNTFDDLLFDTSWDWLMPVYHKCIDVVGGWMDNDSILDDKIPIRSFSNIGDLYRVVVEFIKWYNENKEDLLDGTLCRNGKDIDDCNCC